MKQRGFTLIELIVVLVILGILAATAAPLFVDLKGDANKAVMQGVEASTRSAAAMVYAKALIAGQSGATGSVSISGTTINLVNGYPSSESISDVLTLQPATDFTVTEAATATTIDAVKATTAASCRVTYNESTAAGIAPVVALTSTGC